MKAPLLIGTDVMNMSAATLETFSNVEVVGVNQDELGEHAAEAHPPWAASVGGELIASSVRGSVGQHARYSARSQFRACAAATFATAAATDDGTISVGGRPSVYG